ncbi:DivIVA domain-containing protein [Helicovermis profundi]|uniref:DivIVA domain-containing protein n=1 Tax=Helicovermis profundi TaxID=3065157 RepID=A0AAU9E9P0_9FIRM|nr:DivIVA domain-containing protein [Clostridia bacterium S502]
MITPLDIEKKVYSKSISGYSKNEVEDFNFRVAEEMENLIKENEKIKEKMKYFEAELSKFNRIEKNIRDALVTAEKTSDEVIKNSQLKSEIIIDKAESKAIKIIDDANNEVLRIKREHEEARKEFLIFKTRFKTLLNSQLDVIEKEKL